MCVCVGGGGGGGGGGVGGGGGGVYVSFGLRLHFLTVIWVKMLDADW